MDNEIRSQSKPLNMQLRAAISAHSLCKGGLHCKAFVLWENKEKEKEEKKKKKNKQLCKRSIFRHITYFQSSAETWDFSRKI